MVLLKDRLRRRKKLNLNFKIKKFFFVDRFHTRTEKKTEKIPIIVDFNNFYHRSSSRDVIRFFT